MASISPNTLGAGIYTVTASRALVADLRLDIVGTSPFAEFQLRFPAAAAGVEVRLDRGAATSVALPVLDGATLNDNISFANRRILASATAIGAEIVIDCQLRTTAGAAAGEAWSVRARAADAQTWQLSQIEDLPGDPTITRVLCDPASGFTVTAATFANGAVREQDTVTLTAAAAGGTAAAPTVVGGPVPAVSYRFTKTGFVPITAFPACSASQTMTFTPPGVYRDQAITISEQVWFETGCGTVGFLNSETPAQALTIRPRTQHLALVLDRSGSMSGPRWDNATTAAQIMGNLFLAMRSGVNAADRITEIVFEDQGCSWHGAPVSPLVTPVLPLTALSAADLCGTAFGAPGSCTPIGDGLIRAIDDLAALGVADDPHFTIVLLTDGYENSGTVIVDPNTPAPAGIQKFGVARQTGAARQSVNARLSVFTIGVGATVQEDVLDALATQFGGGYRLVAGVTEHEVAEAMAQMASLSQATEQRTPEPGGPAAPRLVHIEPGVSRLAIAVLGAAGSDTLTLERRVQGAAGFTPVAASVRKCAGHHFVWVDVAALHGGDETAVPAADWHIQRKDTAGATVTILDKDLLVFVDLFVRTDLVFDREHYATGDPIRLTARVRAGSDPVTGTKVVVELARPGESLGSYLAVRGSDYRAGRPRPPDPHAPKAAMLAHFTDGRGLPIDTPTGVFDDGTDELFDDGEGNYTNRYSNTDAEGTYTWRVTVTAELPDGSTYTRVLTLSRWVGVSIDPAKTETHTSTTGYEGYLRTSVTVVPRDRSGQYLGPFRPTDLRFTVRGGHFQAIRPSENSRGVEYRTKDGGIVLSRYDGGYTRVVETRHGEHATVLVTVKGVELPPIEVGERVGDAPPARRNRWLGEQIDKARRKIR
ncbi:vWA domain-containing protein [Nocardia sp. NPDC050712]|uniref:vWA domain-containing protein n=1 Tax=Nocardia sp. NPDC050712 TaxID=3155518 RepID=UPI0033C9F42A